MRLDALRKLFIPPDGPFIVSFQLQVSVNLKSLRDDFHVGNAPRCVEGRS